MFYLKEKERIECMNSAVPTLLQSKCKKFKKCEHCFIQANIKREVCHFEETGMTRPENHNACANVSMS